ncbi:MAG TPA: copper resistance protein B [Gammaproteobacteria bacterium]
MHKLIVLFSAACALAASLIAQANESAHMDDNAVFSQLMLDQFENRFGGNGDTLAWEAQYLAGGDFNKLWIKSEGDRTAGITDSADAQLLYDRAITAFWDMQLGVRQDFGYAPSRTWLAFGVQGLAPYFVDLEAAGFIGPNGRSAARVRASYELLFSQRLILEPELETNLYGRDDPARRVGSGLSNIEFGLRLRYEFRRQFAPYIGVVYARSYGHTADYLQLAGEQSHESRFVAGLRVWF